MSFRDPIALLLLLVIPLFVVMAWPRRNPLQLARDTLSLAVRCLLVLLIILALAGLSRVQQSNKTATLFLLDASDSIGDDAQEAGWTYIRQALDAMAGEAMADEAMAGIVVFGADALVERPISHGTSWREPASIPESGHTDIASAIQLGITLFPEDAARRMVILSDGGATRGDARQAAQLAQANGIELSTIVLPTQGGDEVRLEKLDAPALLYADEEFDLDVTIHSTGPKQVPLQIFSRGQLVAQQTLTVQPGDNSFVLPLTTGESGFTTFQARIAPTNDTHLQNNTLDAFSQVRGPLQLLVVAAKPDEGQPVARALRQSGLNVQEVTPAQMPSDLGQLSQYRAVILVNVPAPSLAPRQLTVLQTYVRDLGHGLVAIGGEDSYGPGGYFQTRLEELLPVNMVIEDTERLPPMSIMMIIDKSGSMESGGLEMGGGQGGVTKVELAKEAIARSLDLLLPHDRMAVVAFSDSASWVVEPTSAANRDEILGAVGAIRAAGGTDILAGLERGATSILEEPAEVRHIILLTDGGADPSGILELAGALAENKITTSVVAIGQGYAPFLEDVARIGGGRFHFADRPEVIPQIFALETTLATRSYVVEEPFTPAVVGSSPILLGVGGLPQLKGYVATSPKQTAQVALQGGVEGDPLLAQWQYGLGRAVAWTSDAKGQWAADWIGWPEFARFWSQAVRWTVVESSQGSLETSIRMEGDNAVVRAEVLHPNGDFRNNLHVDLSLIAPDLTQQTVRLKQVAPGLYENRFQPDQTGTYLLHVTGQDASSQDMINQEAPAQEANQTPLQAEGGNAVVNQTRGFVMRYSAEYRTTAIDQTLLPDLAAIGGGKMLDLAQPAAAVEHTLAPVTASTPLWPWLLAMACFLLPIDVGLRRLAFDAEGIRRLWNNLRMWLSGAGPDSESAQNSSAGSVLADNLLRGKEERRSQVGDAQGQAIGWQPTEASTVSDLLTRKSPISPPSTNPPATSAPATESPTTNVAPAPPEAAPPKAAPPEAAPPEEPDEVRTVRQLMKAKQKRQKK